MNLEGFAVKRYFITALIAATVASGPVTRAAADAGSAIAGGIIGGIVAGAIINEGQKNKRKSTTSTSNTVASGQRAENREVQSALNYFGFNAGTPDGAFGRQTRAAVSSYQATLGYPITGELSTFEKEFLLSSYQRAQAGGSLTLQQIAGTPGGATGLLVSWRDELARGGPATMTASVPLAPMAPVEPAAGTGTLAGMDAAVPQPPAGGQLATFAAPTFLADGAQKASLASQCTKVSLMTATNGGFATLAPMQDSDTTLGEQFCLARTYAIASGEELASKVQGFTPAQIETQCKGFGPAMAGPIAALSVKSSAEVLTETGSFILTTGMSPAQLIGTAKICLSVGYRTDDMDTAVGSALLLTALGEQVYAELLGHHLMLGFGASAREDLSRDWYRLGLAALDAGRPAVFAPGQPERSELIRAAVFGAPAVAPVVPAASTAPDQVRNTLPGFAINK
jgi:peptidoglycan hydrolase-like protein with peptidoglycan-binding domain